MDSISRKKMLELFLCSGGQCCYSLLRFRYTQTLGYVNVRMKWKKDPFYDTLDVVNNSKQLRPILALASIISRSPSGSIPISSVSKQGRRLEISGKVIAFLRKYPSFFHEFIGPQYNLPWFCLTPKAIELYEEEQQVFEKRQPDLLDRVRCLILMSRGKVLPLRIIHGMHWYLGLPEDFVANLQEYDPHKVWFQQVEIGGNERGLCCIAGNDTIPLSTLQRTAVLLQRANGECGGGEPIIEFPLYPSKGVRLKKKIASWLEGFQRLPYISPYTEYHHSDEEREDVWEKRVVGVLHELLCLFVDHSAERRKLLCLRKHLGLPQKFHRVFERHPHIFYNHLKNKTCTVVLKEAYHYPCKGGWLGPTAVEAHPMLSVRERYVGLMRESEAMLRRKRMGNCRRPTEEEEEEEEEEVEEEEDEEDDDNDDVDDTI